MTREELVEASGEEELLFADGFDEALMGTVQIFNRTVVLYDRAKCIEVLCRDMSREDAEEHFSFNVVGAWVGEGTPAFADLVGSQDAHLPRSRPRDVPRS